MPESGGQKPQRNTDADLGEMFDLDRKRLTKQLVAQMEDAMRAIESAQTDLKEIIAAAKQADFRPRDLAAMKRIAQLRIRDQVGRAQEELAALQRVGEAVGLDLFNWADARE